MQFVCFHLMPWPHLPADFEQRHESAWLDLPNSLYDPVRGHTLYNEYLDQLVAAERLGFDVIGVNEHHQNAYGLMPSPNIMAASLIQRTSRIKVLVLGNALPLYDHPQRVAEELAMLDVLSGGRLISGMVVGLGVEAFAYEVNPTFIRERYREAHDLIVRAWTEPGPFHFEGKHYDFRWVNVWPRPLQQPHPPIWIPGSGSMETIRFVAERRYPWIALPYSQFEVMKEHFAMLARVRGDPLRLRRAAVADRLARDDLRGGDRQAGARGIRAALLVHRQEGPAAAARVHVPARPHLGRVADAPGQRQAQVHLAAVVVE